MKDAINDLTTLFEEAKQKREFEFVQVLINYTGVGTKELSTNLQEWFAATEFYKELYFQFYSKEKTRMGTLLNEMNQAAGNTWYSACGFHRFTSFCGSKKVGVKQSAKYQGL